MKAEYDFSKARRGALAPAAPGKTRITIRLDNELIEWFKVLRARSMKLAEETIRASSTRRSRSMSNSRALSARCVA